MISIESGTVSAAYVPSKIIGLEHLDTVVRVVLPDGLVREMVFGDVDNAKEVYDDLLRSVNAANRPSAAG